MRAKLKRSGDRGYHCLVPLCNLKAFEMRLAATIFAVGVAYMVEIKGNYGNISIGVCLCVFEDCEEFPNIRGRGASLGETCLC